MHAHLTGLPEWHRAPTRLLHCKRRCLAPHQTEKKPDAHASGFLLGLVAIARAKHPVPSRTRKLSAAAAMVLRLKTWESSSPPNLAKSQTSLTCKSKSVAGWSSQVARQAHNLKVRGSNPLPATNFPNKTTTRPARLMRAFLRLSCRPPPDHPSIGKRGTGAKPGADKSEVGAVTQ